MSLSKDDILNAIAEMSVMDVVALVEAMEEKFGVSAAAAVAAAPAAAEAVAAFAVPWAVSIDPVIAVTAEFAYVCNEPVAVFRAAAAVASAAV